MEEISFEFANDQNTTAATSSDVWDKLNGDKLPAHVNPWVWVYKFPKYKGL